MKKITSIVKGHGSVAMLILSLLIGTVKAQQPSSKITNPAKVDFDAYEKLVHEVKNYRKDRLVNLEVFLKMAEQKNVIILDTRSEAMYKAKHVKGAINLCFSDFTQENLAKIIHTPDTKILIYCNNNFDKDPVFFATKAMMPSLNKVSLPNQTKELTLALNIPTFINLYGYGYKNIYELSEMISVFDNRIQFEGTSIRK